MGHLRNRQYNDGLRTLRLRPPAANGEQMIAAIYARKSTKQRGADDEARSVQRQFENARAFAAERGWTVERVYSDDAIISGTETRKLKGRQKLLDAIVSGKTPFQGVVMRDESRFSRGEADLAIGELKPIETRRRRHVVLSGPSSLHVREPRRTTENRSPSERMKRKRNSAHSFSGSAGVRAEWPSLQEGIRSRLQHQRSQ
jgi:Resolvase, N terminal domain